MTENGLFAAREAHVAGERQLAPNAGGASPDAGDRNDRSAAQAHQDVVKGSEAAPTGRKACRVLRVSKEIIVSEEEAGNRAVEHDDLELLVILDCGDNSVELRDCCRPEDIEWRVVERNAPVVRRAVRGKDARTGRLGCSRFL